MILLYDKEDEINNQKKLISMKDKAEIVIEMNGSELIIKKNRNGLAESKILNIFKTDKKELVRNEYGFMFEYEDGWEIILYYGENDYKDFNCDEDCWDDAIDYWNLFFKNGGNKYHYKFQSFEQMDELNVDFDELENKPIEKFKAYLIKEN